MSAVEGCPLLSTSPAFDMSCMNYIANRSSPLEKIAQQITCPICMEAYHDPKALTCLHTYCKKCIQGLIRHHSRDQQITCPQCRKDVPVAGNNVDNLPTVFFINELIDIYNSMKQASVKTEIACQSCSQDKAVAFCRSCDEKGLFICTKCEGAHKQMKMFTNHEVVSLAELKQGSLIHLPSKKTPAYPCSKHNGELKKLYCFTCSQFICCDCTRMDHPKDGGHKYDLVSTVATAFKNDLKVLPLQDANTTLAQALSRLESSKKDITEQGKSINQTIQNAFSEVQKLLEEHKKHLLRQAKETMEKKMRTIETQQNELKMAKSECESVLDFVKLTSDSASDEEIVTMKDSIETRVKKLATTIEHTKVTPTEAANMIISVPYKEEIEKLIKKQGFIAVMEGGNTEATTGKTSVIKLRLINEIDRSSLGALTITAELQSLIGRPQAATCTVSNNTPSVCELSCTPRKRGRHQLTIRVSNTVVANYPIFVHHAPKNLGTPVKKYEYESTWRIAVSENGDIYVTQYALKRYLHIHRCGAMKRIVKCVDVTHAKGIDVDSKTGSVFITGNNKLQKYSSHGELVKQIGGISQRSQSGKFDHLNDVRFYKNRVYACDSGKGRVQIFDTELNYVHSFGAKGEGVGELQWPEDIDFDTKGNAYIVDSKRKCVLLFSPTYDFMQELNSTFTPPLIFPIAICIHGNYMYISDGRQGVLACNKSTGKVIHHFLSDSRCRGLPVGIAVDVDGYVYSCHHNSVFIY